MQKTNKNILKVIVLIFTIISSLFVIEIALRNIYRQEFIFQRIHILSDYGVFSREPNLTYIDKREGEFYNMIKFNSKGLRDYEYPYKKDKSIYRIIMVGDSFTDATQVKFNESIPKIIENELRKSSGNYEVINFGFSGYGLIPEAVMIREEVLKYEPDMIVLNYFIGNDLTKINMGAFNDFPDEFWIDVDNEELKKEAYSISASVKIRSFLTRNSMIYFFIKKLRLRLKNNGGEEYKLDPIYEKNYSFNLKKELNTTKIIFKFLNDLTKKNKIKFIVTFIPPKEQVDDGIFNSLVKKSNGDMKDYEFDKLQKEIKKILDELDIGYIDVLPQLRKENINNTFYYDVDAHFDKGGYNRTTFIIYDELKKEIL